MLLYFSLFFAIAACAFEIYILFNYVRCKGKYPPFVTSFGRVKKDMLNKAEEVICANKDNMKIVDLGCGSGSLLIPLAKKFPKNYLYGYEWDLLPYFLARLKTREIKNITIYKKDFMKENFDLILCNLGIGLEKELGCKLNREISKDTIILSEIFKLAELKEEVISSTLCGVKTNIFLYRKND